MISDQSIDCHAHTGLVSTNKTASNCFLPKHAGLNFETPAVFENVGQVQAKFINAAYLSKALRFLVKQWPKGAAVQAFLKE